MPRFPVDYSDRREIGRTGETVSAIGLGTWAIRDYERAYKTFMYALENGIDNIDTAEIYDSGRAEEFVGRVVRDYGRDNVFITTKMHPGHLVSRDDVLRAARRALGRLGIRYVDLYLIHWPNTSISIAEQVRNFEILVDEGATRYIGVSNFDGAEIEEAMNSTRRAEIVVDQVHYSVLHKDPEEELLPFAIQNHVTIQAYTPIERGAVREHPVIRRIAERTGRTPVQVALNYLLSRPRVIPIPKTETLEHLKEILGSMGWRLRREDLEELEKI